MLRSLCKYNRILINVIKVGIEMKYKISLVYNLVIIIGLLIILCILIFRGYDIYVILILILIILVSLINLFCDIKKYKWFYINVILYLYKVVFFL